MSLCVHVLVCMCVYVDGSVFHLPPDIHLIYRLQLQYADFFLKLLFTNTGPIVWVWGQRMPPMHIPACRKWQVKKGCGLDQQLQARDKVTTETEQLNQID